MVVPDVSASSHRDVIVLATASSGYGHLQAAQNIACALQQASCSSSVVVVNIYDLLDAWHRYILEAGWRRVSLTPGLCKIYRLFHRHMVSGAFLPQGLERYLCGAAERLVATITPNRISHFVAFHPAALLVGIQLKKLAQCQLALVATDFVLHSIQCHKLVDRYFVPPTLQYVGAKARAMRNSEILYPVGIPVTPDFCGSVTSLDRCDDEVFNVLVSFGGSGYRGLENLALIAEIVKRSHPRVVFSVVTGRNSSFRAAATEQLQPFVSAGRLKVLGFVHQMAPLMASSHLLIGKAGGLTLSEALCVGLPVVVADVLPGQEDYNAFLVRDQGLGLWSRKAHEIVSFIELLRRPALWADARARAIAFGRPQSSARIAQTLMLSPPTANISVRRPVSSLTLAPTA